MLKIFRDTAKSSLLNVVVYHFKFVDVIIIKSERENLFENGYLYIIIIIIIMLILLNNNNNK